MFLLLPAPTAQERKSIEGTLTAPALRAASDRRKNLNLAAVYFIFSAEGGWLCIGGAGPLARSAGRCHLPMARAAQERATEGPSAIVGHLT
jgi:hypothetical protein